MCLIYAYIIVIITDLVYTRVFVEDKAYQDKYPKL